MKKVLKNSVIETAHSLIVEALSKPTSELKFHPPGGNTKTGSVPSVNITAMYSKVCRAMPCHTCQGGSCYACNSENFRPNTCAVEIENLRLLEEDPEQYWSELEISIMNFKWVRIHSIGEFQNYEHFARWMDLCNRQSDTNFLAYTKRHDLVTRYIKEHGGDKTALPGNLTLYLSAWYNREPDNPYDLPVAYIATDMIDYVEKYGGTGKMLCPAQMDAKDTRAIFVHKEETPEWTCATCAAHKHVDGSRCGCWSGKDIVFIDHGSGKTSERYKARKKREFRAYIMSKFEK